MIRRHGFKLTLINATGLVGMIILSMLFYLVFTAVIFAVVGFDFFSVFDGLMSSTAGSYEAMLMDQFLDSAWIIILVGILLYICLMVVSAFYTGGIYKSTAKAVFEDQVSYMDFFVQGFRYWFKLILLTLLQIVVMLVFFPIVSVLSYVGMGTDWEILMQILIFIAEIILFIPFSFAPIIIVQENVSAFKGLLLSFKLYKSPLSLLWTCITMFLIALGISIVFVGIGFLIAFFSGFFSDLSFDATDLIGFAGLFIYFIICCIVVLPFAITLVLVYQVNRYRTTLRPKLFGGGNPPSGGGGNGGYPYTPPTDPTPYTGPDQYVGYGSESTDSSNSTPSNFSFGSDPTPSTSNQEEQAKPTSGTNTSPSHGGNSSFDPPSSSTPTSNDGGSFNFGDQNNYTNYGSDDTNKW